MTNPIRTLGDLGERGLIERLRRAFPPGPGVVLGPGDDAAVVRTEATTLVCADVMVEGVHFDPALSGPADAGFKAVVVNASDIAAMGGVPRHALLSLVAPTTTPLDGLDAIVAGVAEAAAACAMSVAGGDCSAGPCIVLAVTALGEPPAAGPILRSGARPGDLLCVTGALGAAAAGLGLLRAAGEDPRAADLLARHPALAAAHRRPPIRIAAGAGAAAAGVAAMIDLSDGLARDATHIARESATGVRIDAAALPVADGVAHAAALLGGRVEALACGGGEDYELAMAVAPDRVDAVRRAVAPVPLTVVGAFTQAPEQVVALPDGSTIDCDALGWDHFA